MLRKRRMVGTGALLLLIGCWLVPLHAMETPELAFDVRRFMVEGDNPLSDRLTQDVLSPYLGRHEGLAKIQAAGRALEAALVQKGYAFHRAVVPPQKISDGVVTLRVIVFRLNAVGVKDNTHFSRDNVLRALPILVPETGLNTMQVLRAVQMANAHPTRQLAVFVQKSTVPGSVDAQVQVTDRRPYRFYATLNDTGDPETGDYRLSVGFQHANLFDCDHMVAVSYTTSPEYTGDVNQGGINYRFPVYRWSTWFSAFYTRSDIDQGIVGNFFEVSGKGNFFGILADHRLTPHGAYQHHLSLGLQDRLFENDTLFGIENLGTDVRSRPLALTYSGRWEKAWGVFGFLLEGAANMDGGGNNDEQSYTLNRLGSDPDWVALRFGFDSDLALYRRWRLRGRLSGQYTDEPLISGEQFGIGGYRSVRGYYEREVIGDLGQQITLEVHAPTQKYDIQPIAFFDAGQVRRNDPHPGQQKETVLTGAGVGLRWFWQDHVSVTLDLANAFKDAVLTQSGDWRLHFNVFVQF